uniref:Glycosyltransferase 2-like domain-containing protein n=1 Tax=viral metagenome TaxID=1070528 RepID=A0A6C0F4U1_9ZZZZ
MDKVTVIIPTYNRFMYLLNTIDSIKKQSYPNVEIIVINDCSTQEEYYQHDFGSSVKIIHLPENTKRKFGFASAGHVRNEGIRNATGKYIAFCDDDDTWFPDKLVNQVNAMVRTGCKMSCTEGIIGEGVYNSNKQYRKYNSEHYFNILKDIYRRNYNDALKNGFPEIWDLKFVSIHNCIICSSVIMEKELLYRINGMLCVPNGQEDYNCWLMALQYTNCVYVNEVCFYYDAGHGYGQNY